MVGRLMRWGAVLGLGAAWWVAAVRLALGEGAGVLEGSVVLGGWGLGVLPVHCVAWERAAGAVGPGRWREAWRGSGGASGTGDEGGSAVGPGAAALSGPPVSGVSASVAPIVGAADAGPSLSAPPVERGGAGDGQQPG